MNDFLYEVVIKMHNEDLTTEEVSEFINSQLVNVNIVSIKNNLIVIHWPISKLEGPSEIEETLYYVLNGGELGKYTYTRLK